MINILTVLLCVLLLAILGVAAYYASYQWVNLRHNRDMIADELKRSVTHIDDLEARIAMLEAQHSLQDYKATPQEKNKGWDSFNVRG